MLGRKNRVENLGVGDALTSRMALKEVRSTCALFTLRRANDYLEDKCNTVERRQTIDGCVKVGEHGHRSMEKGFWIRPGQVPQLTREVIRAMPERIFFCRSPSPTHKSLYQTWSAASSLPS